LKKAAGSLSDMITPSQAGLKFCLLEKITETDYNQSSVENYSNKLWKNDRKPETSIYEISKSSYQRL